MPRTWFLAGAALVPLAVTAPARAQRTDENVVAQAEDAFGTAVGHESIGIYDESNVRGFNPGVAGNFRMEGLYFDIEGGLGGRIIGGETIHVGPSAQGFPFPAPTGIVDLALRKPDDKLTVSPFVSGDSFGTIGLEVDSSIPIHGKDLGLATGVGLIRNHTADGGVTTQINFGAVPRWRPAKGVELSAFYNRQQFRDQTAQTIFLASGEFLPGPIERARYFGPGYARNTSTSEAYGVLGHAHLGEWTLRGGVFRSRSDQDHGFTNLIVLNPDRSADHQLYASPASDAGSWSGELRLSRRIADGPRQHLITLALRGRTIDAHYGGGNTLDLGTAPPDTALDPPAPASFGFTPTTLDQTRQATVGLAYSLLWKGLGSVTLGLQRTHYIKRIDLPGVGLTHGSSTATLPWLSATAPLTHGLALYGSYVKGLEDAGAAPSFAANANAVLPAIRTSQADFGLRWLPAKGTTLILGGFHIAKPYIDIDTANLFGVLGQETHDGIEASLTSDVTPLLRVVAGGVWQRPRVVATPSIAQPVGPRPVGQIDLRTRLNVTWTLPFARRLTLDAYVNHDSGAPGTVDNTVIAPGSTRIGAGARYRFTLAGKPVTARIELYNVFNVYELVPFGSGAYGYNTPRNVQAWITMDI